MGRLHHSANESSISGESGADAWELLAINDRQSSLAAIPRHGSRLADHLRRGSTIIGGSDVD